MAGGTFAPGLVQYGAIDLNFIQDDWGKDLIPGMNGFDLASSEKAAPVFRDQPFFTYKGVSCHEGYLPSKTISFTD